MWTSVILQAASEQAEALSDALMEAGALSISIDDADAGTAAEEPQFGEPGHLPASLWKRSKITALFDTRQEIAAIIQEAAVLAGLDTAPSFTTETIHEQNWVKLTQSQFDPIHIVDRLWIVPSWHTAPDTDAINIELDPGMAFGTGSHPTTRLCLEWLYHHVTSSDSVLDYGCGSGILGIAAGRLGARAVLGIDIDPRALETAGENSTRNHVVMELQHSSQPLEATFDLVVANILTNPLCVLAPLIAARVGPGGKVALSGVLETQSQQVIEAWAPYLSLEVGASFDGWVRLEGHRATTPTAS